MLEVWGERKRYEIVMEDGSRQGTRAGVALMAHMRWVVQGLGETGNLSCVLLFSHYMLCRGRGRDTGWTKLDWTRGKLIFGRQISIYQSNKKKKNTLQFLHRNLDLFPFWLRLHAGWGGSMSCVARVCGKSLKAKWLFLPATELLPQNSLIKLSKLSLSCMFPISFLRSQQTVY